MFTGSHVDLDDIKNSLDGFPLAENAADDSNDGTIMSICEARIAILTEHTIAGVASALQVGFAKGWTAAMQSWASDKDWVKLAEIFTNSTLFSALAKDRVPVTSDPSCRSIAEELRWSNEAIGSLTDVICTRQMTPFLF
ncbi:hypothetical protein R3P38DRAFT_3167737 [Favolaschia claudopus]|uniref:Uncharacterized protein n=1 Tax=Favolaschia claudopus TaxID=2862362 RepID=A0AAW0E5S6_9AGAR